MFSVWYKNMRVKQIKFRLHVLIFSDKFLDSCVQTL